MRLLSLALLFSAGLLVAGPALADQAAADACAAGLDGKAKPLYLAALPKVKAGTGIKDALTVVARAAVGAGTLARADAKVSATAAGNCLKLF